MNLLIATHNQNKLSEFKQMLAPMGFNVTSLLDYPEIPEVKETGTSFRENALLKSETIAKITGKLVLADDSGLIVPSLGGEPGIYSARYSGNNATAESNNQKLLKRMKQFNLHEPTAFFNATLSVSYPDVPSLIIEGEVEGIIIDEKRGIEGFGYDPLFYIPKLNKTFAELKPLQKNKISHRAVALASLIKALPAWLKEYNIYEDTFNK